MVPFLHLIQVGKEGGAGQSPVGGDDCVGALAAHRKGASCQVPGCLLQHFIVGGMVDGKGDGDLGDLHRAHHAVTGNVQAGQIFLVRFIGRLRNGEGVGEDGGEKGFIVSICLFPFAFIVDVSFCFHLGYGTVITADQPALPVIVPLVGNKWVQQQGQTG